VEKELKIRIHSKDDFFRLVKELKGYQQSVKQTNWYWDTNDFHLLAKEAILRIREEEGRRIITWKKGKSIEDGYFVSEEIEAEFPGELNNCKTGKVLDIRALPKDIIENIQRVIPEDSFNLYCIGYIETERRYYSLQGFKLEVDHIRYPDGYEDFELEVETEKLDELRNIIMELLKSMKIDYSYQTQTKFQRFLKYLH